MDDTHPQWRTVDSASPNTADEAYAERLLRLQNKRWKKVLDVQRPYRWNIQRRRLGRVLDVGCGTGRNLAFLGNDSVGVDHNAQLVAAARERGLNAVTTEQFFNDVALSRSGTFDALLAAHLIEHLEYSEAASIMRLYLPYVRPGGQVLFITPQERGFAFDPTHVSFTDFDTLRTLCAELGLVEQTASSFPFPRWAGRLFVYNEFNLLATVPTERTLSGD